MSYRSLGGADVLSYYTNTARTTVLVPYVLVPTLIITGADCIGYDLD
jgi:hypothetical protein